MMTEFSEEALSGRMRKEELAATLLCEEHIGES
jgi:hypothetical protein